jgi:cbb3-type cytochrome oxidase maturation protein
MESLYLLIPVSIILVFAIGVVFWWSLKSGQMEDLEGPAYRILMDDDNPLPREGAKSGSVDSDQGS